MDLNCSFTLGEGRTGTGQLVNFSCPKGSEESVRTFLKENVRTIDIPITDRVIVHGGYGGYTRYDIYQHEYIGGGHPGAGGYIEVLEIKNPPDGRWGIVINEYNSDVDSAFTEWETIENALSAFAKYGGSPDIAKKFPDLPGFKRRVACGALTPWFYAIGNEQLIGDYTFPNELQDDPIFRFGKQFVIHDRDGIPMIKTCMGTRFIERKHDCYPYDEYHYRLVYWDDGSVWNEKSEREKLPRLVRESEVWITEAIRQFRQLLAGKSTEFTINFTDGNKFVGKLARTNSRVPCAEGKYFLVIYFKNKKTRMEGWTDFIPSQEAPDVIQYAIQRCAQLGEEVERVEIKKCKTERNSKKWSGVFFHVSH